ncbi:DNA-binding FadR family transcriptional regulator [Saccharomonospora amisosensis]|uniref:DNA-binding FadR family transcriptional regulator n=1 Tax=Saccharomonospora amisosensis TaxID=1128677 RepID=A0A7X5UNV1_9PSEU|nr:winged helix-turn-helix domain-containing protein [Saccharomonospora amisosensis]NIJ11053.1 DNA-binding FadR family transcriptional regulator [Saccharomonospora amisosensis]
MGLDRNEIAAQLRRDIAARKYKVGDKLPGYRKLAEDFGAAPNTVGEAVRILAAEGLVRTKKASRAVVASTAEAAPPENQVSEAREVLADLQDHIRDVQRQLRHLEQGVSDALRKLNGTS